MKKPLLLLAATAFTLPASAQTERGATMIGLSTGNLNYSRAGKGNDYFSVTLYPSAARFVADNLAVGAALNLGYARQHSQYMAYTPAETTLRTQSYGLAPFARYYFIGQGKHQLFAEAGVDIGRSSTRYTTDYQNYPQERQTSRRTNKGWHAALGYNYFVTPNAALEASVGYYRSRNEYSANGPYPYLVPRDANALNVRVGFNIFLASGNSAQ